MDIRKKYKETFKPDDLTLTQRASLFDDVVESTPEEKAKSAKTAMLTSRINTLLSLPMLLSMVAAQNLY